MSLRLSGIMRKPCLSDLRRHVGLMSRFLRWSALQECAFVDEYDGLKRVWSESHVSEDFQIALNVQTKVRLPLLSLPLPASPA